MAEIECHRHVRISDFGEAQRFAAKLAACRITQEGQLRESLDRDIAVKLLIAGAKNHTHSAGADLFDDAVVAKHLANRGGGDRHQRILGWRIAKVNNTGGKAHHAICRVERMGTAFTPSLWTPTRHFPASGEEIVLRPLRAEYRRCFHLDPRLHKWDRSWRRTWRPDWYRRSTRSGTCADVPSSTPALSSWTRQHPPRVRRAPFRQTLW